MSEIIEVSKRPPATVGSRGIEIQDMDQLWRFAGVVAKSGLAPKGVETQEAVAVAVQMGLEVGMTPMASMQNIAVINGRPTIWGDAQLAIVRATGEVEEFAEWFEIDGQRLPRNPSDYSDKLTAVCRVKRKGQEAAEVGFSVADAKRAQLWGKAGPWTQYPFRMLKSRARSFALRDNFGDAMKGMLTAEEAQDIPTIDIESRVGERRQIQIVPAVVPAIPDKAPEEPRPEPPPTRTKKEELWALLQSVGATFEDFTAALKPYLSYVKMDAVPESWEAVTEEQAVQCLNRRGRLKDMFKAAADERVKGGAK